MSPTLYKLYYSLQCHGSVAGGGVFSPTQVMWYHSSQPSHCIMLSRHSGISQVQNTCISWYGNHGYSVEREHAFVSVEIETAFA